MSQDHHHQIVDAPLGRAVLRFGLPLAIGMLLQNTFNLVDAYLIAQLDPAEVGAAIGALGICDQVAAVGTIVSYGISTATAAVVANQKGSGDRDGICHTSWQSI